MQVSMLKWRGWGGGGRAEVRHLIFFFEFCGQIPDPWDWKIVQI